MPLATIEVWAPCQARGIEQSQSTPLDYHTPIYINA